MSVLNNHILYWRHINKETFMYGTKLRFDSDVTYFENPLMPSGTVIHDWHMITNFNVRKTVPSLPILKKGHYYQVTLNYQVEPQGAAYIKLTFYRKNDTELSYLIIKDDMTKFQFPAEAYAYKIELINAGLSVLHFQNIKIKEVIGDENVKGEFQDESYSALDVINRVLFKTRVSDGGGQDG
ncbi:accessory Sec system protein Asp3 [Staphylococcus petrasii]|uniref:accessory Sec system protein Asp3 n=1 Tax=Staphylococcus petrasii TaxID=1276936 RepID=UPI0023ECAF4A|nr:accessory Sec system protein Asp3 [Staphylococcus petrasii]